MQVYLKTYRKVRLVCERSISRIQFLSEADSCPTQLRVETSQQYDCLHSKGESKEKFQVVCNRNVLCQWTFAVSLPEWVISCCEVSEMIFAVMLITGSGFAENYKYSTRIWMYAHRQHTLVLITSKILSSVCPNYMLFSISVLANLKLINNSLFNIPSYFCCW